MWKHAIFFLTFATIGHTATQTVNPAHSMGASSSEQPPFHIAQNASTQSYMMISPVARAQDFQQAYEMLRKEKTSGKVYFQLADGSKIFNVIEMTPMPNSTLVLFKLNSQQGIHFQIVKIEDIANISY